MRPELHPAREDAAEKSVGRERGVRERHAWRRQSELQVAPGVQPGAPALYIQVAVRSAERSCAALVAAESLALLQPELLAQRSPKPPEALPPEERVPPATSRNAPKAQTLGELQPAATELAVLPQVAKK